jgi:hypothetical protein
MTGHRVSSKDQALAVTERIQDVGIGIIRNDPALRTQVAILLGRGTYRSFTFDHGIVVITNEYVRHLICTYAPWGAALVSGRASALTSPPSDDEASAEHHHRGDHYPYPHEDCALCRDGTLREVDEWLGRKAVEQRERLATSERNLPAWEVGHDAGNGYERFGYIVQLPWGGLLTGEDPFTFTRTLAEVEVLLDTSLPADHDRGNPDLFDTYAEAREALLAAAL